MTWDIFIDVCAVLGAVGTFCGTIIALVTWCRKPKARLRFANGKKEITFSPHYCRYNAKKYYVMPPNDSYDASTYDSLINAYMQRIKQGNEFVLPFRLTNTGKLQLENYRVEISYDNGIQEIGIKPYQYLALQEFMENTNELDGVCINNNKRQIGYSSQDKSPLNQKDDKDFAVRFSPNPDAERIELYWRISAKDFFDSGKFIVHLAPTIDECAYVHFRNCKEDVPEGGDLIEDLKPYIEHMKELLPQTRK